jgi:hypothetical protein
MPIKIQGAEYYTAAELTERLEVSRQTLWRWRQEGKIPQGHRYRNRHVVFTPAEAVEIEAFANRIEPIDGSAARQMSLFAADG